MKQLFFRCLAALVLLLPFRGHSQTSDTTQIHGLLQYMLQPLNKSAIPTGFLEGRGLPAIPMHAYGGVSGSNNGVDLNLWRSFTKGCSGGNSLLLCPEA